MAAPAPTARIVPTGEQFADGHPTKITFSDDANISLWELQVTPVGLDSGDPINCTTMLNTEWRTMAAPVLKSVVGLKGTVAYNAASWNEVNAILGTNQTVTLTHPDGATIAMFGYLKSFLPGSNTENQKPTAEIEIVITNRDPASGDEEGPVFTAAV